MKFYFVRHGETQWNVLQKIQGKTDIPLNENGIRQAANLARKMKDEGLSFEKIYTSPHLRASETAKVIGSTFQVPCIEMRGLAEMNMGDWEGLNWDIIEREDGAYYQQWLANRRYMHTPQGECYNDVVRRNLVSLKEILEAESENVVVVSHSAVLMALQCYLNQHPFEEMVKRYKTKNAELVTIDAELIREGILRFEEEKIIATGNIQ